MSKLRTCMGAYLEPLRGGEAADGRRRTRRLAARSAAPCARCRARAAERRQRRDPGRGARGRARPTAPAPRRASARAPRTRCCALWNWLARPPVAAGFASVMAATLVGLMWWDRPMDETLAASAGARAKRREARHRVGAGRRARAPPRRRPQPTAPTAPRCGCATRDGADGASRSRPADAGATSHRRAKPGSAMPPTPNARERKTTRRRSERGALRKNDAPAAFPSTEVERASRRRAPGHGRSDAKKEARCDAGADAFAPRRSRRTAPTPAPRAAATRRERRAERAARPRRRATTAARRAAAGAARLARRSAPSARRERRPSAVAAARGAGTRSERERRRRAALATAPLASLLAALADDSAALDAADGERRHRPRSSRLARLAGRPRRRRAAAGAGRRRAPAIGADAEQQGTTHAALDLDGRAGARSFASTARPCASTIARRRCRALAGDARAGRRRAAARGAGAPAALSGARVGGWRRRGAAPLSCSVRLSPPMPASSDATISRPRQRDERPRQRRRHGADPGARRAHAQPQEHRPRHPEEPARRDHGPVGIGQVEPGVRHALRRRPAPLRREPVGVRAPVPAADGQARRRRHRGPVAGDLDRAEGDLAQPALDRRHGHRDPRLPAPAVRARRHAVLPEPRPARCRRKASARWSTRRWRCRPRRA